MAIPAHDQRHEREPQPTHVRKYAPMHRAELNRIPKHMTESPVVEAKRRIKNASMKERIQFGVAGTAFILGAAGVAVGLGSLSTPPTPPLPEKGVSAKPLPERVAQIEADHGDTFSGLAEEAGVPASQVPQVAEDMTDRYGLLVDPGETYAVHVPKQ